MKIQDIVIGQRQRTDAGDIESLAKSIRTLGLLHPIVVSADRQLVAGWRRIQAFKLLGREEIPHTTAANISEAAQMLLAERDENTCRKDFTPSEAVAMGRRLEEIERPAAQEREKSGKSPSPNLGKGRTTEVVGAAVGMSHATYEKAKAVVAASEANPAKFKSAQDLMDRTGKVDAAFKTVKRIDDTDKLPFDPQAFNVWSFLDRNPAFGREYPGNIPGDIIQNLLWLYTTAGSLVVDPFAGGGVTQDVCRWWTAKMWPVKCLSLDAKPCRADIEKNDVTHGYPKYAQGAALVFLDPPYWKQKRGDYQGGANLADMNLAEFHDELEKVIYASFGILSPGGRVALLLGATRDGRRYDHAAALMARLSQISLEDRIIVTYSTQQAAPFHVAAAKKGKLLLNRYRDLVVWRL